MGGLGALNYAARNPGMFRVAASFNGIVPHSVVRMIMHGGYLDFVVWQSTGEDPLALWGDPDSDEDIWQPVRSRTALVRHRALRVGWRTRTARPRQDQRRQDRRLDQPKDEAFVERLMRLRLDIQVELYGSGIAGSIGTMN